MSKTNLLYAGTLGLALTASSMQSTAQTAIGQPWNATIKRDACYKTTCPVYIHVDGMKQMLNLYLDGQLSDSWRVSTGGVRSPTPTYNGKPIGWNPKIHTSTLHPSPGWIDPRTGTNMGNMPYSIFFDLEGHALHGTPTTAYLGQPASNGCVRQDPINAQKLWGIVTKYHYSQVHITITGTENPSPVLSRTEKLRSRDTQSLVPHRKQAPDAINDLLNRW